MGDRVAEQIGRSVTVRRQGAGWSRAQLSEATHIAIEDINQIEAGSKRATLEMLEAVAAAFGCEISDLFEYVTDEVKSLEGGHTPNPPESSVPASTPAKKTLH